MKKVLAGGAAAALATAGIGVFGVPMSQGARSISVKDDLFAPKTVTVSRGTTVRWVWRGSSLHNVKVTKGPVKFHSAVKSKGTFSKKLTRKGTYTIICTLHAPSMKMTLRVR